MNECVDPDVCSAGSTCVNKEGSYDCNCHTGYFHVINNEGNPNCSGKKQLFRHVPGIIWVEYKGNFEIISKFPSRTAVVVICNMFVPVKKISTSYFPNYDVINL